MSDLEITLFLINDSINEDRENINQILKARETEFLECYL